MTDTALFIGWGGTYPGREHFAQKTYTEFIEKLGELRTEGVIEDFVPVLLSPHGGELDGFILIHGEPEKLTAMLMREDMHRLEMHARLDNAKFSVIYAAIGERVPRELKLFEEIVTEYEREPALV